MGKFWLKKFSNLPSITLLIEMGPGTVTVEPRVQTLAWNASHKYSVHNPHVMVWTSFCNSSLERNRGSPENISLAPLEWYHKRVTDSGGHVAHSPIRLTSDSLILSHQLHHPWLESGPGYSGPQEQDWKVLNKEDSMLWGPQRRDVGPHLELQKQPHSSVFWRTVRRTHIFFYFICRQDRQTTFLLVSHRKRLALFFLTLNPW